MERVALVGRSLARVPEIRGIDDLCPPEVDGGMPCAVVLGRYMLIAGVFLSIVSRSVKWLGYAAAACVALILAVALAARDVEPFLDPAQYAYTPGLFQQPTPSNPAMNVLPTTYVDDPQRPQAAPAYDPAVAEKMTQYVADVAEADGISPFLDEGDDISLRASMRTWYATANTQIPNAQDQLAQWCYGDMPSCKEGNPIACAKAMPPNWISG